MLLFGVVEKLEFGFVESLVLVLLVHGVVLDDFSAVFDCLHHSSLGCLVGVEIDEVCRVHDVHKIIFDAEIVGQLCYLLLEHVLFVLIDDGVKMILGIVSEAPAPKDDGLIGRVNIYDFLQSIDGLFDDLVRELFGVDSSQLELQLGVIGQVKFHIDMVGCEPVAEESNQALQYVDEGCRLVLFKNLVDLLNHSSVDFRGIVVNLFPHFVAGVLFDLALECLLLLSVLEE